MKIDPTIGRHPAKINTAKKESNSSKIIPAIKGPIVKGIVTIPNRNPIA